MWLLSILANLRKLAAPSSCWAKNVSGSSNTRVEG